MAINQVLAMAEKSKRRADYLEGLYYLSWCADYHKRMSEFRSLIGRGNTFISQYSDELQKDDSDFRHRTAMLNATGLYYYSISDYPRAIQEYSKIISLDKPPIVQDSALIFSTCAYLAQSYHDMGNFDLSMQYFDLGSRYLNPEDPEYDYQQAVQLMYQGQCMLGLKQFQRAMIFFKKALQLLTSLEYRPQIRNAIRSAHYVIAGTYNEVGIYDSALWFIRRSIPYHKSDDPYYIITYLREGSIFYNLGNYDSASNYFSKAHSVANKFSKEKHVDKATALRGLGDVSMSKRKFKAAQNFYQQALSQLSMGGLGRKLVSASPKESLAILIRQAKLYYEQSKSNNQFVMLDSCIRSVNSGVSLIDDLRRQLLNLETKEFIASEGAELYATGVMAADAAFRLTHEARYLETLFFFMEKSKANILLDKTLDQRARAFVGIPTSVLETEKELLGTMALLHQQIQENDRPEAQQQYMAKQREYVKFMNDVEEKYPRYHDLKYNTAVLRLQDVKDWLGENEVLISYFIADSTLYILGVDHDRVTIDTAHWSKALQGSIDELRFMLNKVPDSKTTTSKTVFSSFIHHAHVVFAQILERVLKKREASDLTIIGDGKLYYIPFEVLLTHAPTVGTQVDYSRLPYLLKDYQIKYAYSTSLALRSVKPRKRVTHSFLGFAPTYSGKQEPNSKFSFSPLFNNQREIQVAAEVWDGKFLLDSAASENAFKTFAPSANILQLAAHTFIDDIESSNSGIALSSGAGEDGFLYTYELYNLALDADLAILSGCETGVGEVLQGEGVKSLARAFKFAGCNSMVMSLWKVDDRTTADIMSAFHNNLSMGMEKDQALRMAKVSYLENNPMITPFYWGALVLVGDDEPVHDDDTALLLLMSLGGMVLVFFLFRKKVALLLRRMRHSRVL